MAIKCEAIVPEAPRVRPCIMENRSGCRVLAITDDVVMDTDGKVYTAKQLCLEDTYRPCPPGSKFVIQLTAGDGTFPRAERCDQGTDFVIQHEPNVSIVMPHKGPWSNRVSGEIHNDCACMFPLPNGTKTTITFCDGQWTCEIKEPEKDWLPVDLGDGLRFERAIHDRATVRCHSVPIGINPAKSRELSEVAARFADEQEFPVETFPRQHNSDRSVQFDERTGHLWFGNHCQARHSCITTEEEGDFMIRAIRDWKRLRKEVSK